MVFNSLAFAIFLPLVFLIYWIVPHRFRWIILLISSYYFYMSWNAKYVVLILFTTAVSYSAARILEVAEDETLKKTTLAGTLILCLGVLFVFKYLGFFFDTLELVARRFSIQMNQVTIKLLLPVGISFYTFQTLSYVIDVYRGDIEAEHHFGKYATFISFFPQLVAGPIERSSNLLPQIDSEKTFDYDKASYGMKLMAWGFFKKLCVADVLAVYVDKVFSQELRGFEGFSLVIAVFCFTLQIYCDFSGYSDIAIGSAKLMGIDLMTNFKSPYFSASVREFWSRWHISLSTWFKDYLYIPMGGSRCKKSRHYLNLMVTFLVSGLWHGASWSFVAWGGLHGLAQVAEDVALGKQRIPAKRNFVWFLRVLVVFAFCNLAWIFFRADSFSDAWYVLSHLFTDMRHPRTYLKTGYGVFRTIMSGSMWRYLLPVGLLTVHDFIELKADSIKIVSSLKPVARWCCYIGLILMIIVLAPLDDQAQFIYFQF